MLILKHLKTLQHVSIIIREFVGSLLKSVNLKFYCQQLNVVMRQHNVWCDGMCGEVCWTEYSVQHTSPHGMSLGITSGVSV
jgi:hypothetical protein